MFSPPHGPFALKRYPHNIVANWQISLLPSNIVAIWHDVAIIYCSLGNLCHRFPLKEATALWICLQRVAFWSFCLSVSGFLSLSLLLSLCNFLFIFCLCISFCIFSPFYPFLILPLCLSLLSSFTIFLSLVHCFGLLFLWPSFPRGFFSSWLLFLWASFQRSEG